MTVSDLYTPKQIKVLQALKRDDWRLLINYGAVRSGKTVVDNDAFLFELRRIRKIADDLDVKEPMYILAGYSSKSLQNNVLQELSNKYGINFKFDKHGSFTLFGVKIVQTFTGSIAGLGAIRGMSSFGAYVNEASLANEEVFNEILNRCSQKGARIICDTNPDIPTHFLKSKYIDNTDAGAGNLSFHFTIDDNTFLSKEYLDHMKAGTPSGMFYDRAILGLWASSDGMVYSMFDRNVHYVNKNDLPEIGKYIYGVDWGYEHSGEILVVGYGVDGNYYLLKEISAKHKEIDWWVDRAKEIVEEYGDYEFWCDTARTEHIARFTSEGLDARYADKKILDGIETVAKLFNQKRLFAVESGLDSFNSEIYEYIWDEKKGKPVKENDHCMDAMRYAIYNNEKESNTAKVSEIWG